MRMIMIVTALLLQDKLQQLKPHMHMNGASAHVASRLGCVSLATNPSTSRTRDRYVTLAVYICFMS